ncbi:hypothetical protein AB0F17_02900 [Nonomuraea sp. NPDC026600]|uniref:hypothetical protein n=1 Tax=Nonomuraea sp. NPDC026600 TaxID=3155363 RepID=UPI0033E143C1
MGVTVEAPFAADAKSVSMEVCWNGGCKSAVVTLNPSSRAGEETCSGDTCSVGLVPTGGKNGFGTVEGLPKQPVEVRLDLRDTASRSVLQRAIKVTPQGRFPNGPQCGQGGPNVELIIKGDGTLREG